MGLTGGLVTDARGLSVPVDVIAQLEQAAQVKGVGRLGKVKREGRLGQVQGVGCKSRGGRDEWGRRLGPGVAAHWDQVWPAHWASLGIGQRAYIIGHRIYAIG